MLKPKFRTAYGERIKTAVVSFKNDEGKTIQEQAAATDINYILERYNRTGLISHVNKHEAQYGEFKEFDFQRNQNMIAQLTQTFEELPANVRRDFDDKVENFAEYIASQENIEDMKDGIIDNLKDTDISKSVTEESDAAPRPVSEKQE